MRKYIRSMYRAYAEKNGMKPSSFVSEQWERLQIKRYGKSARICNVLHGTKPAYKWRQRHAFV